jgi:hypothetical protein
MATCTVVFTDNGDGTCTATSASATAQTFTSKSIGQLINVARGWVDVTIPLLTLN